MRWRDQSEAPALPPVDAFLETLGAADRARVDEADNTLPRIFIPSACHAAIMAHLDESRDELGGLLIGRAYSDENGTPRIIAANTCVESRTCDSTGVSLRMETQVWDAARPLLGPDAVVVGWYHSHPDLGAFFSETDRVTQRSFFRQAFSIGIVIDPVRDELRAFLGPDCTAIPPENVILAAAAATPATA